jgi:hypothetical protein
MYFLFFPLFIQKPCEGVAVAPWRHFPCRLFLRIGQPSQGFEGNPALCEDYFAPGGCENCSSH